MFEALPLQSITESGLDHEINRVLFEHAGTNGSFYLFAGAAFQDNRIDSLQMQQMREHQPGGTTTDDSDLGA